MTKLKILVLLSLYLIMFAMSRNKNPASNCLSAADAMTTNIDPSCTYENVTNQITIVCHVEEKRVDGAIQTLPADTEQLRFKLFSNWNGKLPKPQEIVNISSIYKLAKLKYLAFQSTISRIERRIPTRIIFEEKTFQSVRDLQSIIINIPLYDQSFANMVKHFEHLETLDLSETKFLSSSSIYL